MKSSIQAERGFKDKNPTFAQLAGT